MNKKTKGTVIGVLLLLFVFLIVFAVFAGTRVGADIGEFAYNVTH